jgi:ferritin-like protein
MAQSSAVLHESPQQLSPELIDRHRAIVSLMEELEAIDWYDQRIEACQDAELGRILIHNRDEEKEHVAMTLEWLRRHDSALDRQLRKYLFRDGEIPDADDASEPDASSQRAISAPEDESLRIGSLRRKVAP